MGIVFKKIGCPLKKKTICSYCNSIFEPKFFCSTRIPKYCSRLCMSLSFKKVRKKIQCKTCLKEFEVIFTNVKRKFCSPKCITIQCSKNDIRLKWRLGKSFWNKATEEEKFERYKQMFEDKVVKTEDCWGWNSFINSTGCGMIGSRKNLISAYRFSWILHNGKIPNGLLVLHKCNNRICSNPKHLYLGNNKDNAQDKIKAGNSGYGKRNYKTAKLDIEKVKKIKDLLLRGISFSKIANMFDISSGAIQKIKENKTWRDV